MRLRPAPAPQKKELLFSQEQNERNILVVQVELQLETDKGRTLGRRAVSSVTWSSGSQDVKQKLSQSKVRYFKVGVPAPPQLALVDSTAPACPRPGQRSLPVS